MDTGIYCDDDEWTDDYYGPGYLCPKCGVPKHPAPSYETGPNGETLLICESCGFMPGYEED